MSRKRRKEREAEDLKQKRIKFKDDYKQYKRAFLKMSSQELKEERFICENLIRKNNHLAESGRISVAFSFLVFSFNSLSVILSVLGLDKIFIFAYIMIITMLLGSMWFVSNAFIIQNKRLKEAEEYHLKIKIIDEILEQRRKNSEYKIKEIIKIKKNKR